MLAIVVAAGLAPNTGAVPAQGNCQYNQCIAGTSIPWWLLAVIVVIVVAALLAALLLMRRGRRPPSTPMQPYTGPSAGAGPAGPSSPAPSGPAPEYLETAQDVGAPPPVPPVGAATTAAAAGGAGAAAGAAATNGQEPDIDSLMAELDKISSEILKRPKGPAGGSDTSGSSSGSSK
jgi:hypothetical protein